MLAKTVRDSKGFTIIELMIATTVFSVILLLCASALIQLGRIYQKNVISNQTQEVSRTVIGNISESVQFSGGSIQNIANNSDGTKGFCVGNKRYSYQENRKLVDGTPTPDTEQTNHGLVVDSLGGCSSSSTAQKLTNPTTLTVGSTELLAPHMRVLKLNICTPGDSDAVNCPNPPPATTNLYQINVIIAYGDGDLLSGDGCKSLSIGGSFCAVSALSTTVQKRIIR